MPKRMHPLREWINSHPEFSIGRDSRRVFGVWPTFLFRVLAGQARPRPNRAKEWETITGIPFDEFLFFNGHTKQKRVHQRQ